MLAPEHITATLLAERLPLTAFFACVTRDFHLAEDVFQEVCVKAEGRAETFESTAPESRASDRLSGWRELNFIRPVA